MRVGIWPPGELLPDTTSNDGCTEYRQLAPARPLIAQGADVVIDSKGPSLYWNMEWHGAEPPPEARIMGLAKAPELDAVVLQRPARRWWAEVIPYLQREGIRVIVDMDDLLDKIDKRNIAHAQYDPRRVEHHNHKWAALACELADVVTVTTPALLKRYGYGHGVVLPNLIPESYLGLSPKKKLVTMGWTGNVGTHPADLQVTSGAVGRALDETGWGFHVIGTGDGVQDALGLVSPPSATGYLPFAEYADALGELAIAVVPLADTKFNEAKSCLKMMEFAALGVAVVATATADNLRLHKLGVGDVVKHPSQWDRALHRMIKNRGYREHVAGKSREVLADHTYEKHCWRWAKAWGLEKP